MSFKDEKFTAADAGGERGAGTFSGAVVVCGHSPYRVHVKDDGCDYPALWRDFMHGRLELLTLKRDSKREVHVAEAWGRKFIIKVDRQSPRLFKNKLRHLLGGPMHSGIMRRVNLAVRRGCAVTPDIYLVAEKMEKRICRESCIIQEYLPDPPLWEFSHNPADIYGFTLTPEQKAAVSQAFCALHAHRLALADLNPYNILVGASGYKVIDLSWGGSFRVGQAIDVLTLRHKMDIRLPVRGLGLRLALLYLAVKYKIQDLFRSPERAKLRWRTEPLAVSSAKLRPPAPEEKKERE